MNHTGLPERKNGLKEQTGRINRNFSTDLKGAPQKQNGQTGKVNRRSSPVIKEGPQ